MEVDEGGAGAAISFAGEGEGDDAGVLAEQCMDGLAELSDALAVDETHFQNAGAAAFSEVFEHDLLYVAGSKRMEVQHAIYRNAKRFIHGALKRRELSPVNALWKKRAPRGEARAAEELERAA